MSGGQTPPAGEWDKPHRAVVFIHGVGEQGRGDTLMDFLTPIVAWMRERLAPRFAKQFRMDGPQLESYPREGGSRASVRLTLGGHRIEITEALWATSFRPLPNDLLIRWSFRFLTRMWWWNLRHVLVDILLHPNARRIGAWHVPIEVVHALLLALVLLLALPLGMLLLLLLWLMDAIPVPGLFPSIAARALRAFMDYLAEGFGDAAAYMEDAARRDAIRQVAEDIMAQYQGNPDCTDVTVVCHSQGTVIAYDLLAPKEGRSTYTKCRTLITMGSILSPVQRMYPHHPVFERSDGTHRRLQGLKWLFIHARYDPGPGGELSAWFELPPGSRQILVDNRDTFTEDHVTYSVNDDQVVSLIVDEMFRSSTPAGNPYFRDEEQRGIDFRERRSRVARLSAVRAATYVGIAGTFLAFAAASVFSAAPAASALNGLAAVPLVGQSVRLVYRLPSAADGTVTFEAGYRIEPGFAAAALSDDARSFVVKVMDRNDQPRIVDRELDRFGTTPLADGGWTYTVDESTLRTGFADLVVWRPVFKHLVLPALFAAHVGVVLIVVFRLYRDIVWKHRYDRRRRERQAAYKEWREAQPS